VKRLTDIVAGAIAVAFAVAVVWALMVGVILLARLL
jgi:hypothetical protein